MIIKFNDKELFNLKVNLVIIKTMYKNIKKHDSFKIEDGHGSKYMDIHDAIGLSKPRYYRILNGYGFRLKDEDVRNWSKQLGIQSDYFTGKKRIKIIDADDKMWEAYFKNYNEEDLMPNEKRALNNLLEILDETTQRDFVYHYNINDAVYRLHYYFSHGSIYPDDNWQVKIDGLMERLDEMKLSDWERLDASKIENYIHIITKQNRYAQAALIRKTAE